MSWIWIAAILAMFGLYQVFQGLLLVAWGAFEIVRQMFERHDLGED